MKPNLLVIALASLIPLVIGFKWYNPKVLGKAWMNATGVTPEHAKGANMAVIFGLSMIFNLMLAFQMQYLTIHQASLYSLTMHFANDPEAMAMVQQMMDKYGGEFRNFHHGVIHGLFAAVFIVLPVLGTNALFERKGWKYIAINVGYWAISFALMGGVVCKFS